MTETSRADVLRLPPLTLDEAKVVNTLVQLGLMGDHPATPELKRKFAIFDAQILTVMDWLGKTVELAEPDPFGEEGPVLGKVVEVITAEEYHEKDWEDLDDFPEGKRGTMLLKVTWYEHDGTLNTEHGYRTKDLRQAETSLD